MDNKEKHKEHYEVYLKVATKVNELTAVINELGDLPLTGNDNIDNLHPALLATHKKTIEIFIKEDAEDEV
ncbi:hypothetical protein [Romboutsia sp.]|uniref:hypothetical protein n=1 Tax=Romboutsia sp. TaxID=1965302 RepID=UPI002B561FA8|nr:hypothetical protein [Romboutsia sp.]HSQ87977.1 hypothetical protein [Romboutsia sp.]